MDKHIVKGLFATGPGTHAIGEVSASVKQHVHGRKTAKTHIALAGHLPPSVCACTFFVTLFLRHECQRLCVPRTLM